MLGLRGFALPFLALAVTACADADAERQKGADIVTPLSSGQQLAAVNGEILWSGEDGLQAFSPANGASRRVVDETYRGCPWKNSWRSPGEVDVVRVTYVGRVAYVHQALCGLWTVSLDESTKITPVIQIDDASGAAAHMNSRWGDGAPARVDPSFHVSVAADGEGDDAIVCLSTGGSGWDDLELWSVGADGQPRERLAVSDAIDCEEVVQAGGAIFFTASVGGLHRFDRASRALTRIGSGGSFSPRLLTPARSHLFFMQGGDLHRVGLDGKGLTKIERPRAETDSVAALVAADDDVFLATQSKIVRVPLDGPIETVLERDGHSRIAAEHGLVRIGADLWFSLFDGKNHLARFTP